ncbi:HAD family hydrolase [Nocardioides ferulae]|uniref:HAD family hydrolase n=1 Tax=Nocardioides ferulae TaxID=2340821 RepID=UPI000EAEDBEA|nr:HAD-IA family hydrolase [Nocardioides ferulae]
MSTVESPAAPAAGLSSSPAGVVWDFGNVLVDWDPLPAIAAGVGEEEARRFLDADDFDFMAWNYLQDAGRSWAEAEAEVARTHPHWAAHARAYRAHFTASLRGAVPGTPDLVRELHAAGVRQFGLTNWSHELYPHAPTTFDFLGLLEDVVVSGTERVAKPNPAVFEVVRLRTGLPMPRLVFVDDRRDNVVAATAAGMDAVVFTSAERLRLELRDRGLPV